MCSVTILQDGSKLTVTMNRDETLERPVETSPHLWKSSNILAPLDTKSAGTWIGANQDGMWACLLNGYLTEERAIDKPESRGKLIPDLLNSDMAFQFIDKKDLSRTPSFRLLVGNNIDICEYFWDGKSLSKDSRKLQDIEFFTSSSLEQDKVAIYRRAEFDKWKNNGAKLSANNIPEINLFHEKDNKEYGVLMQRSYSETKSITQITIDKNKPVTMSYWLTSNIQNQPEVSSF